MISKQRNLKDSETNRTLLASARKTRKLYQFFAVIIATAFISSAITLTISADGPTGFGTVIEPGSMVSESRYIVFADGATIYARNGTTGEVEHESSNMTSLLAQLILSMPTGGSIHIKAGDYTLPSALTIQTPGIVIIGDVAMMRQFVSSATDPTRLIGNVNVYSENIKFQNLCIQGVLTFGSTLDLSQHAHYVTVTDCAVLGQVRYEGRTGAADAEVPFNIVFIAGEVRAVSTIALINVTNLGAPIQHIWFYGTTFEQQGIGQMIDITGWVASVIFTSCLFLGADGAMLQLTSQAGGTNNLQTTFNACTFEMNPNATLVRVPIAWSGGYFYIHFISCSIVDSVVAVYDRTTSGAVRHRILFSDCAFIYGPLNFNTGYSWHYPVETTVTFVRCSFPEEVVLHQYGVAMMFGEFDGCLNLNYGKSLHGYSATPFTPGAPYMFISYLGSVASPTAWYNYTVCDAPIWVTSTGGTNVSITIKDNTQWWSPVTIASGLASLNMVYLPVGFTINFGPFTVAPTVIITFG